MYEDRRNNFSIRDLILQLLLILLFIFVMIWLFPTKGYLKNNKVESVNNNEQLEVLYGRIFADNIESMRDAATAYFTKDKLPSKGGESVKLTLKEMYDKKLVLEFKDSNNNSCDLEKSYVELTKMDNEYQMKVQLTCSDYNDYIITHMGCYGYCNSDICEKKEEKKPVTPVKPTKKEEKEDPKDPEPKKPTPVVSKKTMYEYVLKTEDTYSKWSDWSNWSKEKVEETKLKQVDMETRNEITGYEQVYAIIGYDEETITTYETKTKQVEKGTIQQVVGSKTLTKNAVNVGTKTTEWAYQGYVKFNYAVSTAVNDNSTVKYVYVSDKTYIDCSNVCANVTEYTYKKYTRTVGSTSLSCASYGSDWTLKGSDCIKTVSVYKDVPAYETVTEKVPVTSIQKTPVYGYVNGDPIYTKVKYYRYRTREQLTTASTDYKWSESKTDSSLLNKGYVLTGNSKEV